MPRVSRRVVSNLGSYGDYDPETSWVEILRRFCARKTMMAKSSVRFIFHFVQRRVMTLTVCRKRLAGDIIIWIGRQVFSNQSSRCITYMQHSGEFAEVLRGVSGTNDVFWSVAHFLAVTLVGSRKAMTECRIQQVPRICPVELHFQGPMK